MTRHQCKWILIGLLITFFDFSIENFDIVPDLAGWGVIIYHLTEASTHYKAYSIAKMLAIVLLVLSFIRKLIPGERQKKASHPLCNNWQKNAN